MRLLATYIRKLGIIFDNICFNFSNDFKVTYKDNILEIVKTDGRYHSFYGNVIKDITVLIGKNGTGKTTLLDVIGNPIPERIYSLNMDKNGITDSYFMLYEMETDFFYLERVGKFDFINIESNKKTDIIDAFFFKKHNNKYIVMNTNFPNERINYLSEEKQKFRNLSITYYENRLNRIFIPRCQKRIINLADWYITYIDLFQKDMINSPEIEMRFFVNEQRFRGISENNFLIQAEIIESTVNIDNCILYTTEIFNDFISNHINIVTRIFLNVALSNKDATNQNSIYSFMKSYTNKIIKWNHQTIESFFSRLYDLFKDHILINNFEIKKQTFFLQLIDAYREFYLSILEAKDFINPGVDQFSIQMNGNEQKVSILKVCKSYDKLQNIYLHQAKWWNNLEERRYDNSNDIDDFDFYFGTSIQSFKIDQAYTDVIPGISAGEKKLIDIVSNLTSELHRNIDMASASSIRKEKIFLFLIDEVEKEMHPEWSRQFIYYLQKYLSQYKYNWNEVFYSLEQLNIKIQIIMSTHSPFLVSDLHEKSIIKLKRKKDGKIIQTDHKEKSFAQNIQRIITNDFFINGYFGRFAEEKVQNLLQLLSDQKECSEEQKQSILVEISEIGEPIIGDKLMQMYNEKFGVSQEIELYNLIKKIYGEDIEIDITELEKMLKTKSF